MSSVRKNDKSTQAKAGSGEKQSHARAIVLETPVSHGIPELQKADSFPASGEDAIVKPISNKASPTQRKAAASAVPSGKTGMAPPARIASEMAAESVNAEIISRKTPSNKTVSSKMGAAQETPSKSSAPLNLPAPKAAARAMKKETVSSLVNSEIPSVSQSSTDTESLSDSQAAPQSKPAAKSKKHSKAAVTGGAAAGHSADAVEGFASERPSQPSAGAGATLTSSESGSDLVYESPKPVKKATVKALNMKPSKIKTQNGQPNEIAQAVNIEKKSGAVDLNLTMPKVTTAGSSSINSASVAAALKKAAEKIMNGKAAKSQSQSIGPVVQESKLDDISPVAKAPESKSPDVKTEKSAVKAPSGKPVAPANNRQGFKVLEYIVYPAHGVGEIIAVEEQEVAGFKLELFVISFIKDKMILKVPVTKVLSVGMRKLADAIVVKKALDTLMGRARVKRTMWSRRAQEYEAKINSGDLVAIAEVVRDLYRSDAQPEQSYSERQLYEAALDRLSREVGTVQKLTETESLKLIESQLQKGPRRSKAEEADSEGADTEDGDIEEAA